MEELTVPQIRDFVIVVVAILAFIVLLGNGIKTIKDWRKPKVDEAQWRRDTDSRLANDNKRLKTLEDGNKVICKALMAMLSHEINGNSIDKLQQALSDMHDYLIER